MSNLLHNQIMMVLNGAFGDKFWVDICSVGIIGDNVSSQLPNNLIYKYRDVQIDNYLKKSSVYSFFIMD